MPATPKTTIKEALLSTHTLEQLIAYGRFFLDSNNLNKEINGLNYETVYSSLLELAGQIATLNQNPSLFEILGVLEQPNAKEIILSSTAINPEILKYWEEKKEETKELKRAFLEKLEKQTAELKKYSQQVIEKLNQKQVDNPEALSEAVVKEIGVQTDPELTLQKAQKLEEEERLATEQEIANRLNSSIKESVRELQKQGKISPLEAKTISGIDVSDNLPLITQQLTLPAQQRESLSNWIEQQLSLVKTPMEVENIISRVAPATVKQLPEIDLKTLKKTPLAELRSMFKEAAIAAMAEIALDLGEIPPEDIPKIISALTPGDRTEIESLGPLLNTSKEERVLFEPSIKTEPIEVARPHSGLISIFASPSKLATKANPLHFKTNEISIIEEIRSRLYREGVNPRNASFYRNKILDSWSLYLSAQNITPEDIDFTINRLINAGEASDSSKIKELQEVRNSLVKFQEGISNSRLEQIKKQGVLEGKKGNRLVSISGIEVIRREGYKSTGFNSLLGKVFGKKTLFSPSGQAITINKTAFSAFRFTEGFKSFFYHTNLGRGLKIGLQRLAQNSLQGIFGAAKTIFKQGFGSLVKIGLNVLAPGIGSAVLGLGKIVSSLKLGKLFGSGLGLLGNIMGGITGARDVPKNKDLNFLAPVIIGLFVGLFAIVFFNINLVNKGAFVQEAGGEIPGPPPVVVPPHCSDPRHLSETIICKLAEAPCSQNIVNSNTWPKINNCFNSISLSNKEIIRSWFNRVHSRYYDFYGVQFYHFQCLEFVLGVQEALGQNLAMPGKGTAGDYVTSYPATFKPHYSDPELGDVVVWSGRPGHIAIVLKKNDFKITVSQANSPYDGQIDVAERVGIIGELGGPAVYLRYKP